MASLNFPNTTPGVPGNTYTLNGVVYYWDGEKWTANTEEGFTGVFVDVTGDNMTGDLTLGDGTDDKITLDATGGAANFAGVTRIGDPDNADPTSSAASGVRISSAGLIKIKKSAGGGALSVIDENDGTNAYIGSNGNADFAGNVKIGNYNPNAADAADLGVYGFASGSLWINSNAVDSPVFIARKDNIDRVLLNSDGSGTFAGQITAGDGSGATAGTNIGALGYCSISHNNRVSQNCLSIYDGQVSNSTVFSVTGAGTATFAGNVDVASNGLLNSGCYLSKSGILQVRNDTPAVTASINVLKGGNSAGDAAIAMFNDGSASFERNIVSKGPASGGTPSAVTVLNNTTNTYAEFANSYILQASEIDNPSNGCFLGANGNWRFSGTGNTRGLVFELEPDNDANYVTTTDVDEEGNTVETRVYNGPTLDVKERLQNLLARVDAMEANEIVDDATDSSLLQLVASLTARLDEKDAAIASLTSSLTALTSRVTTLET